MDLENSEKNNQPPEDKNQNIKGLVRIILIVVLPILVMLLIQYFFHLNGNK